MLLLLFACTSSRPAPDGVDADSSATSDLAPIEAEAIDYRSVCGDVWPEETCAEEPCDLDATAAVYEQTWREWVQPRWNLSDAEYTERVDLWHGEWDERDAQLNLAHLVPASWHRVMLDYGYGAAGEAPTAEQATAYWANYDPAVAIPFREPLAPYASVIAAAQACADELGEPLQPTGLCRTQLQAIASGDRFVATFQSETDPGLNYVEVEVDLRTAEPGECLHLQWGAD